MSYLFNNTSLKDKLIWEASGYRRYIVRSANHLEVQKKRRESRETFGSKVSNAV